MLREHRPYDASCLIAACVGEQDTLEKVGAEQEKLAAALRWGFKQAAVARETDVLDTEIDRFRQRGLEVTKLANLTEAVAFASGLATGLQEYFELLMEDHSETLPAYMGGRSYAALYVEPDVLKYERRAESDASLSVP